MLGKSGKKKPRGSGLSGVVPLNITSMMDMFTIILVFLLYSFSTQDQNIRLAKNVDLPKSTAEKEFRWAINMMLSQENLIVEIPPNLELLLESTRVAQIRNGRVDGSKVVGNKIITLYNALRRIRAAEEEFRKSRGIPAAAVPAEEETVILFQADRRLHFELIDKVMKTAAMAGYPNFRFAVLKR